MRAERRLGEMLTSAGTGVSAKAAKGRDSSGGTNAEPPVKPGPMK